MAKRGNPNWIRAAEARRQTEVVESVEEPTEMSQPEEINWLEMTAPLVGTLASALALEKGPAVLSSLGIPADQIGLGVATIGIATAFSTKGVVQQIAMSVAAHAIVRELMRAVASPPIAVATPATPARRQADGEEYVTKNELMKIVREFEANTQRMGSTMLAELRPLLSELGDRRREAIRPRRRPPTPEPPPVDEVVAPQRPIDQACVLLSDDEQCELIARTSEMNAEQFAQLEQELSTTTPEEGATRLREYLLPVVSEDPISEVASEPPVSLDEVGERMRAVYERLEPQERERLSRVIGTIAKADADRVTDQLSSLPIEQAVEYVRVALPHAVAKEAA